jgi:hypothetical protein
MELKFRFQLGSQKLESKVRIPNLGFNKAHTLLGNINEIYHLSWTITRGSLGVCESCANTKLRAEECAQNINW